MAIHLRSRKPSQAAATRPRRPRRPGTYTRLVAALAPGQAAARAVRIACELAADHARLTAVAVIEVPLDVPLETPDPLSEAAAREAIRTAQALGSTYGVSVDGVVLHTRNAGEAIVAETAAREAQVVVVAAEWPQGHGRIRKLGRVTDYVLKHAACRVLLIGGAAEDGEQALEPVFRSRRPSDYWPAGEFVDAGDTSL